MEKWLKNVKKIWIKCWKFQEYVLCIFKADNSTQNKNDVIFNLLSIFIKLFYFLCVHNLIMQNPGQNQKEHLLHSSSMFNILECNLSIFKWYKIIISEAAYIQISG